MMGSLADQYCDPYNLTVLGLPRQLVPARLVLCALLYIPVKMFCLSQKKHTRNRNKVKSSSSSAAADKKCSGNEIKTFLEKVHTLYMYILYMY